MNKEYIYEGYVRYATPDEIVLFKKVEKILQKVSDSTYERIFEACSDHAFLKAKPSYNKVYYWAKKFNLTVPALMNWYYITD